MIRRPGMVQAGRRIRPTWYVDSVHGDDANNGAGPGSALRTIAAVLPKIRAGDTIGLARGSRWREQFTIPVNGVQVVAYGSGARPLLDGSDAVAAGSWTKTGGYANVYQATLAIAADPGNFVRVWENDKPFVRAASLASCDAAAGSYCVTDEWSGSVTIYVHATDGSDPAANGKTYEASVRPYPFNATGKDHIGVSGIHARRGLLCPLRTGRYAHVKDCLTTGGTVHSVFVAGGSVVENCEDIDAYYGTNDLVSFVYYEDDPQGLPLTFRNCYVHNDAGMPGYKLPGTQAFYGHAGAGSVPFGAVLYEDCRVSGYGMAGFGGNHTVRRVRRCTTTDCVNGIGGTGGPDTLYEDCSFTGASNGFVTNASPGLVVFRRCTFQQNGNSLGFYVSCGDIEITLDTCNVANADTLIQFANNVNQKLHVWHTRLEGLRWYGYLVVGSGLVLLDSDYNSFNKDDLQFIINGTVYGTFSAYRAATGQDGHSTS